MNWLIRAADNTDRTFDDIFSVPSRREIRRDSPQLVPINLTLYRGFDADIDKLEKSGDAFILSPHKSEQGVIWFSRKKDDAVWRGKWLLTYSLEAIEHVERVHYDDGSYYDAIPQQIRAACSPTENCRFYGGIELPEGWFFSYKVEKYIVCSVPIKITKDMLERLR